MDESKAVNTIILKPLISLDLEMQMKICEIRNEKEVRKWMYTDHLISEDEHLKWIAQLRKSDKQMVFVVLDHTQVPLGVVSVNSIDSIHKKADWAYYLTKNARGGFGAVLEYNFINFIFDCLNIEN